MSSQPAQAADPVNETGTDSVKPHKNVQAAKLAVMEDVGYCQKKRAPNLNYTFAGEAALIKALRPFMILHGLTFTPTAVEILESSEYETSKGGTMRLVRTRQTFRLHHAASDTFEDIAVLGEAADSGDKALPKTQTCAMKYALRQTFLIETGDDPDEHASVPAKEPRRSNVAPLRNDQGGVRPAVRPAVAPAGVPAQPWLHEMQGPNQFQYTALFLIGEKEFRAIAKPQKLASLISSGAITDTDAAAIQAANKDWSGRYAAEADHYPKSDAAAHIPEGASWEDLPDGEQ